jgi:hypothetical protein
MLGMSQMKEFIKRLVANQKTLLIHVPGKGFVHGKVESIDDDIVTIDPEKDTKIVMHYSRFSVKQE